MVEADTVGAGDDDADAGWRRPGSVARASNGPPSRTKSASADLFWRPSELQDPIESDTIQSSPSSAIWDGSFAADVAHAGRQVSGSDALSAPTALFDSMSSRIISAGVAAMLVIALVVAVSLVPQRSTTDLGRNGLISMPLGAELQWRVESTNRFVNSAAAVGDVVAYASESSLTGLDRTTGEELWTLVADGATFEKIDVVDGLLVVERRPSNGNEDLLVLDPATGQRIWSQDTSGFGVAVFNGRVYRADASSASSLSIELLDARTGRAISSASSITNLGLARSVRYENEAVTLIENATLEPIAAPFEFDIDGAINVAADVLIHIRGQQLESWTLQGKLLSSFDLPGPAASTRSRILVPLSFDLPIVAVMSNDFMYVVRAGPNPEVLWSSELRFLQPLDVADHLVVLAADGEHPQLLDLLTGEEIIEFAGGADVQLTQSGVVVTELSLGRENTVVRGIAPDGTELWRLERAQENQIVVVSGGLIVARNTPFEPLALEYYE
jgi:hypothetical protein